MNADMLSVLREARQFAWATRVALAALIPDPAHPTLAMFQAVAPNEADAAELLRAYRDNSETLVTLDAALATTDRKTEIQSSGLSEHVTLLPASQPNSQMQRALEMAREALGLARDFGCGLPHSLGYEFTHLPKIEAALASLTPAPKPESQSGVVAVKPLEWESERDGVWFAHSSPSWLYRIVEQSDGAWVAFYKSEEYFDVLGTFPELHVAQAHCDARHDSYVRSLLANPGDGEAVAPVAYLEPETLNASEPEHFERIRAQTPDAYADWFPVYRTPSAAVPGDGGVGEGCHGLDTPERVRFYEHDFYVLSNFSAFSVEWCGHRFPTSEHVYHWLKFIDSNDLQQAIAFAPSAHEAFKIAERNADRRRADWERVRVPLMKRIIEAKAAQHEYVRRKLLATGERELVEDSWRDNFWGWGPNRDGQNMLGKLWMELRAELRAPQGTAR